MTLLLSRITYDALKGSRQQENYNFQKLSAVLADYGFMTVRLTDDWKGADFISDQTADSAPCPLQDCLSNHACNRPCPRPGDRAYPHRQELGCNLRHDLHRAVRVGPQPGPDLVRGLNEVHLVRAIPAQCSRGVRPAPPPVAGCRA